MQQGDATQVISTLCERYFSTLYETRDFAGHFECHATKAIVLAGPQAVLKATVTSDDYAEVMEQIARLMLPGDGEPLREPSFGLVGVCDVRVDGREAVVRLDVQETVSGRCLAMGVALCDEGDWKIHAIAILPGETLPDYPQLVAMGQAEFAQVPRLDSADDLHLGVLELAYRRLYAPFEQRLMSLPESRFTCQNAGHCCDPHWGVNVDANTHLAIGTMPLERLDPGLPLEWSEAASGGGEKLSSHCGTCVFHREQRCVLHEHAGWAPISTCFTFPIVFSQTPDGLCVSASFACPSVSANVGQRFDDREADFSMRARATGDYLTLIGDQIRLDSTGREVSWQTYRTLEHHWLSILEEGEHSLAQRLARCSGALDAVMAADEDSDVVALIGKSQASVLSDSDDGIATEAVHPHGLALYMLLKRQLPTAFDTLDHLSDLERMQLPGRLATQGVRFVGDDELLTRYVRQLLWRKASLQQGGVLYQFRSVLLAYALIKSYACFLAWIDGREATGPEDLNSAVHAVEISQLHTDHLRRVIQEQPDMAAMMARPEMGDYLLRMAIA